MAKLVCKLNGDFNEILGVINEGIIHGSVSASFEDGSDFSYGDARVAVRIYERYSMMGSNRVSLSITVFQSPDGIMLSAITSGGSQALFTKINTIGESSFLEKFAEVVEPFRVDNY